MWSRLGRVWRRRWVRWVGVCVVLVGGVLGMEVAGHRAVAPQGKFSTLRGFLAWRPGEERFAMVGVGGRRHVIALGARSSWLLLSSGPSAYVFDDAGALEDWTADMGDDNRFEGRWGVIEAFRSGRVTRREMEGVAATEAAGVGL